MATTTDHRHHDIAIQADRAILAGFVACLLASIVYFIAPAFGIETKHAVSVLATTYVGSLLHIDANAIQMLGLLTQILVAGVVVAMIYPRVFFRLPGHGVVRGLAFGAVLWVITQVVLLPLAGAGFFGLAEGPAVPILSLFSHLIFGGVLAAVYGHPTHGDEA